MTEEDAKKKWCPFVVASHTDPRRGFRPSDGDTPFGGVDVQEIGHVCIGSACMAWRWNPAPDLSEAKALAATAGQKIKAIKALHDALPEIDLLTGKEIVEGAEPWPTHGGGGFCGLAGQP